MAEAKKARTRLLVDVDSERGFAAADEAPAPAMTFRELLSRHIERVGTTGASPHTVMRRSSSRTVSIQGGMAVEACSLSGDDLATRMAELKLLLGRALVRERLDDCASFRFRGEDETQLRELTRKEQECCGFWRFSIERDGSEVVMRVGVASPQFEHFVDRFYELAGAQVLDGPSS